MKIPATIQKARQNLDMKSGDTVRVWQKIVEKDGKTRLQAFEGMVLARKHGSEIGATFTVRRNVGGYGVEKIFPLYSPMIDKIEVLRRSKTRRAKLYFVRRKATKEISKRMKMIMVDRDVDANLVEPTIQSESETENSDKSENQDNTQIEEKKEDNLEEKTKTSEEK